MAIARLGAIVAGIAGSLGEVTFANARGALVLRKRQWPPNHHTAPTTTRKHLYSRIWRYWQTLTPEKRATWINGAAQHPITNRLGQTRPRSPWRLFFEANAPNFAVSGSGYDTFRADPGNLYQAGLGFAPYQGGPYEFFIPSGSETIMRGASFRAARSLSTAATAKPRRFAPAGIRTPNAQSWNLYQDIIAATGEPAPNEIITLRATRVASGFPHSKTEDFTTPIIPAGPIIFPNGDFELPWSTGSPPEWLKTGTYTVQPITLFPYGDYTHADFIVDATPGTKFLYQIRPVTITAGHTYRLQFALLVSLGSLYRIAIYTPNNGYWNPFANLTPVNFTRYAYDWTPAASDTECHLYINMPADTAAQFELDNISFREIL